MAKKTAAPSDLALHWLDEIKHAEQREDGYRKLGADILKIYESDEQQEVPFNILFSNTETLLPALFSSQPRPIVQRRFKDDDPLGKMASEAGKRTLEHLLDTNRDGYEAFAEAMESAVLDTLLPGRGMIAVKYDATFATIAEPRPPDQHDETPPNPPEEPVEYAESESICTESLVWDRVVIGYAKKWNKVPWIAYKSFLSKEEVAQLLGKDVATKLAYTRESDAEDSEGKRKASSDEKLGTRRTACVYQIWDKAGGKKIRYVAPSYKDGMLKEEDDPLGLTGFFNTPRPMMFVRKSSNLCPTAPYKMYRVQAQELNRIQKRINKIVEAIKARGVYDGALGDTLSKIMESDDNALIPAETASSLATEKGFENAIWFMPLEVLIAVLVQLYQARESCKQVIYEITGISDILRGSTQASETATAQTIKNQWGTLRLKRMQAEVARYARDLLRMMLELAATKLGEETWAAMTNLPFMTTAQRQQIEMQAQLVTQMQGPLPPDHPLQAELAKPVWGKVLQLLKDDMQRSYRIDIETNSTVEPEATEDKKELNELMGMLGQFLNGVGPLVAKGVMPFEIAQSMMLFVARRHRLGTEIEDYLKQMKAPTPEDQGAEQQMQRMQEEMQAQQQMASKELEMQQKQAEMDLKMQAMDVEMQQKQREMALKMREMELQMKEQQLQQAQQSASQDIAMQQQSAVHAVTMKSQQAQQKQQQAQSKANGKQDR
jgi:hypothetical protein